ncbi:trithorax group protein osa-like [Aethina tumida]|uniref:trithorax group protein osa-like n=1 Tax=Aethina tumida TaxID=116153 RepID=UPI002149758F|nr:trithorax group protein osa-like [Aethina tumida]
MAKTIKNLVWTPSLKRLPKRGGAGPPRGASPSNAWTTSPKRGDPPTRGWTPSPRRSPAPGEQDLYEESHPQGGHPLREGDTNLVWTPSSRRSPGPGEAEPPRGPREVGLSRSASPPKGWTPSPRRSQNLRQRGLREVTHPREHRHHPQGSHQDLGERNFLPQGDGHSLREGDPDLVNLLMT